MTDEEHAKLEAAVQAMPEAQKAALAVAVAELAAKKANEPASVE